MSDEEKKVEFWAYGRERLREAEDEEKRLTLKELEAQCAASQDPVQRSKLKELIDWLRGQIAGEAAPPDERLF